MSDLQQLEDNVATMTHFEPMNEQELAAIDRVVEEIRKVNEIPCTGCRYCMDCPMGVDIPEIFSIYSQYKIFGKEKAFVQDYEEVVEHGKRCGALRPLHGMHHKMSADDRDSR